MPRLNRYLIQKECQLLEKLGTLAFVILSVKFDVNKSAKMLDAPLK